jgi:hypothetical protein
MGFAEQQWSKFVYALGIADSLEQFVIELGIVVHLEAGGEDRTLVTALEARDSAIELHRHVRSLAGFRVLLGSGWRESNPRHRGPKPRALFR